MHIGFTGHRNKTASDKILKQIVKAFGNDNVWIHGGADGFDHQIAILAYANEIKEIVMYPDYKQYGGKSAPLIRNKLIVDASEILIALYDYREKGGTYYTIEYAKQKAKDIIIINPDTSKKEMIKFNRRYWYCDSEWACGLLITVDDIIVDSAPIFKNMMGWNIKNLKYELKEIK